MMIAAAATEEKGFNFEYMNDNNNHDVNGLSMDNLNFGEGEFSFNDDDDGGDLVIDVEDFFTILNEDVSPSRPDLPINPFHRSVETTQEMVSPAHIGNTEGSYFQSGYGAVSVNSLETNQLPQSYPPGNFLSEANEASFARSKVESGSNQSSNMIKTESTEDWLSIYKMSSGVANHSSVENINQGLISANMVTQKSMKVETGNCQTSHSWLDKNSALTAKDGASFTEVPMYNFFDSKGPESFVYDNQSVERFDNANTFESSSSTTTDEASAEPYYWSLVDKDCDKQSFEWKKDEINNGHYFLNGFQGNSCAANNGAFRGQSLVSSTGQFQPSIESHCSGSLAASPAFYSHSPSVDIKPTILQPLEDPLSSANSCNAYGLPPYKMEAEAVAQHVIIKSDPFSSSSDACQASLSEERSEDGADDDDDICVIENMSAPSRLQLSNHRNSVNAQISAFSPVCAPLVKHIVSVSGTRPKALDERLIFQAVVQDLSQPKSEATPPDGVLAVPLLRHQRIALSWMVQKETNSWQCSGGILADDQGLGKTVSTIALILTERAPSATKVKTMEQGELETLDLDEEEEKQAGNIVSISGAKTSFVMGRPSGGTLVVCPTSVLRQWAGELQNKVTKEANLSVYVYHGSSRTKDSHELAKYDVVLTTYSIVSMEVPKQPVVVKGSNDKQKPPADGAAALSSKKRKRSDKKCSKRDTHNELLESAARPLGKVSWFRVVLDEAQSIKNFRTQVAQACWGLRAKRRWCLSGTPIQNAVDDLYSYFRFLRYDPYSVYNSFCTMVKIPITRHPASGYKKLQAVLKTVMLRRTKGTLLDGEPIINLPPKSVHLRKVDFSEEERDFYIRLEADSRAQFQVYAEQGTVKQNYVNILLMLLRLRQACDHPLLVKGYDSSSVLKSTLHAAKKLSQEQQISLLNCLEASLALCGICNDPPEDAVVSICGHVFCNQCISERLTGDESQCPEKTCKAQLSASSVFPKGTLKKCLFDEAYVKGSHVVSASESSECGELVERRPAGHFASAKIKAALEVLQSLSKPLTSVGDNTSTDSVSLNAELVTECNPTFCAPKNGNSEVKEKALVFSQWTSMLDLLEDCLKESSVQYRRLDGTMSVAARDKAVNDFNTLPEVSVMIMSLKAASLGLNMVAACHVLLLDLWWNPTTEDQAIDRAHRIGQTRPVTVVRLTVRDTVEDRILALQQKKRELVSSAFGEDETGSSKTRLTVEDLKYLFMA